MQNPEIAEKQIKKSYTFKEFIFPCGTSVSVQGYEHFALKILVDKGYVSKDIKTKRTEVPEIWYIHNVKKRRYYCDIYIESENKIIEVKSKYTYDIKKDVNILKANACKYSGFKYEVWIMNKDGVILELIAF